MDSKEIEKLMVAMQKHGTKRLVIKKEGVEIELEREEKNQFSGSLPSDLLHVAAMKVVEERQRGMIDFPRAEGSIAQLPQNTPPVVVEGTFVNSPMVGTFYRASSPQDPAYVKVGDKVEPGTIVCIIEAMKVMNEIKAGVSGTVQEVLQENGNPVEFGSKLIRVS